MRCLTLWQPNASLVAIKRKTIETRSWMPPLDLIGGRIGIHAAKKFTTAQHRAAVDFGLGESLPLGEILCTARLAGAFTVKTVTEEGHVASYIGVGETPHPSYIPFAEYRYGDLGVLRCCWVLRDVEPCRPPIPARGYQKLWEYKE